MKELTFDGPFKRGQKSKRVRFVQECLCLGGLATGIDNDFGGATEESVNRFQKAEGLPQTGIVDKATFDALTAPFHAALSPIAPGARSIGALTVAYARQHLKQNPREVGGENCGPWVRLYMDGNEGRPWAWCAGFATYVLRQAAQSLGLPMPVPRTFSCDTLGNQAEAMGMLLREPPTGQISRIKPGALFLVRQSQFDWVHTGIVTAVRPDSFDTIEGNTNDSGDREGYEVCARIRGYKSRDFILMS
jgi:hypothetical protein